MDGVYEERDIKMSTVLLLYILLLERSNRVQTVRNHFMFQACPKEYF